MDWLNLWNQKAHTENYFTQTGRGSSFTMYEFLLYIQDVNNSLRLCKEDNLLDCGCGPCWATMHLSPFVKWVNAFDYSEEMVNKAQKQVEAFDNIRVFQGNILKIDALDYRFLFHYSKVLVGSVLQYLDNMEQVKTAMQNIYNVMVPGGTALFTHNPDMQRKEAHLKTYEGRENTEEALKMENERLWINSNEIQDIAMQQIGFRGFLITPINPLIWQSTHMFDFLCIK
jgi:SAM-dependent methyltransferase